MADEAKIRVIYTPTDETKKTIQEVYTRKRQMEDSSDRQKAMAQWDKWERQWESWREPKLQDDWQSNHVVPITTSVVETALSEIVKQDLRPFILPRGDEDTVRAQVMQSIYEFAWEVSDGDMVTYDVIKDMLMLGTAIVQEYYRVDKRKVGSTTTDGKAEKTSYKEVVDYDDVCTEVVKLQEFYVDEFARGFTGPYAARDCVRRYLMDIDDFHDMYDGSIWDQFKDADKVKAGGDVNYYEFYKPSQGVDTSKQVEVFHYWNKPKDKFIIVANDVLVRDGPNPYKHKQLPFARAVDLKRVHRFYGKGEPELLESIQDEANTLRRMIIDRNHLDIDKMFLVSNKLGLNDEDLMARPHGLIPTDDINGAKPVEYGDIPRSVELSLQHLEDDATISTGINPRAQALPTAGTATEAAILKESTLRRIETKIWLLKKEYLMRVGRLRVSNILQYYSQPKLEKIIGDKRTEEYKNAISDAQQDGSLQQIDGENYKKSYRKIRLEGKEMSQDAKGKLMQQPKEGFSFFELKPEYYVPIAGIYDLKYNVGENVEISKPLMQQKNLDLYDRLLKVIEIFPGSYDPVKATDSILRDYNKNPADLKPTQAGQDPEAERLNMQVQLASLEDQQMMRGIQVPALAFASPVHTRIHMEFMHSPEFQKLPNNSPIIQTFVTHVTGEMMAQEGRSQQGGITPPSPQQGQSNANNQPEPPKASVSVSVKADAATPQGTMILQEEGLLPKQDETKQPDQPPPPGGQPPMGGGPTQPVSVSQGIQNKPNGMGQPQMSMPNVMPALNQGGKPQ